MVFAKPRRLRQAGGVMKIAVFHPGTQHSRQTALALQQLGRLAFLATGLFRAPGGTWRRLESVPGGIGRRLTEERARFAFPALDPALVRAFPRYELPERIAARLGFARWTERLDRVGNAGLGRRVARLVQAEGPFALWGFDGSSFAAFGDPRCAQVPRILDRTIADGRFWNRELARIRETHADWLLPTHKGWSAARIARDEAEYRHATHIVCGSDFAAETVRRHADDPAIARKLSVLPYPCDQALYGGGPQPARIAETEPVRFLFVGQVGARKGIHHLLEAIARLPMSNARLTVAGPLDTPRAMLAPYEDRVTFLGPVARRAMPALMRAHHVLVLPSHFEGSAIVLPEAMASGLALIHSRAAGLGASGASGIVLERPDGAELAEAMASLCADREQLHAMRRAAQAESVDRSFAMYRQGVANLLANLEI